MGGIEKILVAVTDPRGETPPALARGVALARRFGAALHLYSCVYNQYLAGRRFFDSPGLQQSRASLVVQKQKALEAMAERLTVEGLQVSASASWDYPVHEGIVREVIAGGSDLAVVDTHARAKHLRWQLTNTDWQLIRDCPGPLLLARDSVSTPDYRIVIAAVDPIHEHDKPAALDHDILALAEQIAGAHDGRVHAAHAYMPIVAMAIAGLDPAVISVQETEERLEQFHREALDELATRHGLPGKQVHMRAGDAVDILPALVRELDADLLVMGAVSRSLLGRLFIGSTAERVLDKLPCDVLIVKPADFQSPVAREPHAAGGAGIGSPPHL